ncbi:MAG: sigma 54-interacting transcriptional regulator [Deltaproteobacteria bacterium]|jgi:DNA-binding NtrC family response regulator/pSer/pThr/pTyr-binding forkhead associated (FHA) protein|nr:sigma 54-interacting transcriptional regulator [Deltaproteobacteria bacterium]
MSELVAFREDRLGFRFQLHEKAVLGRSSECDLILFDRSASRRHAEIVKIGDFYFISDLDSTNGTLVNDVPVAPRTKLKSHDCVKIGQEIFIFDPMLDVVTGPAPAALILNSVTETQRNILSRPGSDAAASITADQASLLTSLNHVLLTVPESEITPTFVNFLVEHMGATSVSLLWPGSSVGLRQISFVTYPDDKRLLISQAPYNRVTSLGEALLWPRIVTELDFNGGNRHVVQLDQPCVMAPLYNRDNPVLGLLYLENGNRTLEEGDLNFLAALGQLVSPFILLLVNSRDQEHNWRPPDEELDSVADVSSRDHQVRIVYSTASHLAQNHEPIFITGEPGTNKTSLAHHIHSQSAQKKGRFVNVTLSDLPPAQMDRILFGQESAADGNQVGLLGLADNGTIFLRHIEYLTKNAQASILMALEEGLIYPIGSRHARNVAVRFISSSSANLPEYVENGMFREDLYARLTKINLSLPPLREMRYDIESLAADYAARASRNLGIPFIGIDSSAMECLKAYPWPGNLSELRSEAAILANFSRSGHVVMDSLPVHLRLSPDVFKHGDLPPDSLLAEAERLYLIKALSCHQGDVEAASEVLGLTPEDFIIKSRAYGIDPMDFQGETLAEGPRGPAQTSIPQDDGDWGPEV